MGERETESLLERMIGIKEEYHSSTWDERPDSAKEKLDAIEAVKPYFGKVDPAGKKTREYRQALQIYNSLLKPILAKYPQWRNRRS